MIGDKSKEFLNSIYNRLWTISGTLRGVGALLEQQISSPCYDHDDLFGLGQFLKSLGEEVLKIEDTLRCECSPVVGGIDKDQEGEQ